MNQLEFKGTSDCARFELNTLRLNAKNAKVVCMSCSALLVDHRLDSVSEEDVAAYLAHLESHDGGSLILGEEKEDGRGKLFCGSRGASLKPFVDGHDIGVVVNASNLHLERRRDYQEWARKVEALEKQGLCVHRLGWEDSETQILEGLLGTVVTIERHLASGKNVVVHCAQGKSRSGAVIVAYLMYRLKLDADAAVGYAQKRRPVLEPNANFMRQLRGLQDQLHLLV